MNLTNHLYHYTDATTILEIVRTGKLWATDINYMNDSREGTIALKHIENILKGILQTNLDIDDYTREVFGSFGAAGKTTHITAFSNRYDNLSLYRTYGPSHGGYCIGFSRDFLNSSSTTKLIECQYSVKTQRTEILNFLGEMADIIKARKDKGDSPADTLVFLQRHHNIYALLSDLRAAHKSPEFITEEEVRLVASNTTFDNRNLRVSPLGHVMIPYVEIELPNVETDVLITLGPNTNHNLARGGLQNIVHVAKRGERSKWHIACGIWDLSGFRTL